MKIDLKLIIAESKKLGLDLVSFTGPEFLYNEYEKLKSWQSKGFAGEMGFMKRPADLLCDPRKIFEGSKSILVFALYYDRQGRPEFKNGFGRVARYAWGKDYHKVIKNQLKLLLTRLQEVTGREVQFRAFSDAVPLLERALARNAGLGFIGKNSMLIRPKTGSYFFIAEILSNLEITDSALSIVNENCGSCTNCRSSCPTGAIVSDHVIDSNRCISYLTIEKRGRLTEWESDAIGEWVFGCDVCQEVCPFNHQSLKKEEAAGLDDFASDQGAGGLLDLAKILSIRSDDKFSEIFSETALMRAGREGLLRNAAIVSANTCAGFLAEDLKEAFMHDPSAIVRSAAFWSLSKLYDKCNIFTKQQMDLLRNQAMAGGTFETA